MNLPTKLTVFRLFLSVVVIVLLCFPFYDVGITFPTFTINGIMVELQYFIAGGIFILASITDFFDGYLARKNNQVTNLGKMLDAIADKVLVDSVLIILSVHGFIHVIIPVIIILRDIVVDAIKMDAASKGHVVAAIGSGKLKTACLMVGIVLTFFYNMPFEFMGVNVAEILLYIASVLSIVSAIQYFNANRKLSREEPKIINS
ncbi:MAG: CDP-diacylglycerol--glycerol-3-phosphate 3-phosphatidyltransferase [Bacilli bacterium]|nr:CDP-diacylglycerol--glycerol-3-phosphate 3-phosphatidyltransferase [Bacilli bacterium]MBR3048974.1 CDP-diacylglycerol--glycerol-3-phosphate 3-phosphatidyltransferase [Bacilli bacterium]